MQRARMLSLVMIVALVASLFLTAVAGANPPAPGDTGAQPTSDSTVGPRKTEMSKNVDQPNPYDYWRNRERQRLLDNGQYLEAQALAQTANDRVLVILAEYAGTDTFTWNPGDTWDPLGKADAGEAVYDADGNVVVGDCSNIITQTTTFTYGGPAHNEIPRPISESDRSGNTIWTEDFSKGWFEAFMWGDGVTINYTRQDGSVVNEDFTGKSVKDFYQDMSGGAYEIAGDVVGWVQLPHSTWYYGADQCPGARSGGGGNSGAIPGAGSSRQLVKDALTAVNAISNTIPGFDWHNYDLNGDGIIDRLWIVHSGYGEEDSTALLNATDYSESAIWSHSSSVTPPFKVLPDVAAGPYIVMPENGGIGVFAHEYGHNLGAIDLYAYDQGETSAGFWTTMADDWTGYPIGFEPPSMDPMHLDWWGWLKPLTITDPEQTYTFKLAQTSRFPGGEGVYRGAKIELPAGELPLPVEPWQGSHYFWGGAEDLSNGQMVTKAPIAIPAGGATLSFDLVYDIEEQWDFMWVQASEDGKTWTTLTNNNTRCDHVADWVGSLYGLPDDLCAAGIGGFTGYNEEWPGPQAQTFDLSAFAGKNIALRFWYMTDWGTTYSGPFIDNVKVMAGDTAIFSDDAETDSGLWNFTAPFVRNNGSQTFNQRFYLQWRNVGEDGGYDSALGDPRWRYGPANTGLTVWYENTFYGDNEIWQHLTDGVSWGPKGRMLVVDSHPEPYRDPAWVSAGYPNTIANTEARGQMRDATFSLTDTPSFTFASTMPGVGPVNYTGRSAATGFHDSYGYYPGAEFVPGGPVGQTSKRWIASHWDASAVVPAKAAYAVKAPGYAANAAFRFNCSLNALGQNLCYWYPTGLGYNGGTGNPGDTMVQYGWHVQILDQTDQVATIKVWNSSKDFEGSVTQTASSAPVVKGSTVDVAVKATNIGSPVNGIFVVPLDTEEEYVEGSAHGGAFPVTAAQAAELAKQAGGAKIEGLRTSSAGASGVVGVAAMAKPGTGASVNFGFSTLVTADSGEIEHSVVIFDNATFVQALTGDALTIKTAAEKVTETFKATADTHISLGLASTNFGSWPFIYVGGADAPRGPVQMNYAPRPDGLRALLQFDLTGIDPAYPVDSATLSVYLGGFGGGGTAANLAAYEVTTGWAEGTATWKTPWSTPGGDFDPMALGMTPVTSANVGKWVKIDVTAAAQKWVADGMDNHGVMLRLVDVTSFTTYRLPSTENPWLGQNAPVLEVSYRKP